MDYKLIVILVILFIIVFYLIVKEINTVKAMINNHHKATEKQLEYIMEEGDRRTKIGLSSCVDKIKLINENCIVQVRRMNDIGKDCIMSSVSNNYTESDSMRRSHKRFAYLSEGIVCAHTESRQFAISFSSLCAGIIMEQISLLIILFYQGVVF